MRKERLHRRDCSLYTAPSSSDTVAVYSPLKLTWAPSCVTLSTSTVDIYLYVSSSPVHEWTGVPYADGSLDTEIEPSWFNASYTDVGSVSGQLVFVPGGNEIWDTTAPAGPVFTISYNGSYPASITSTASVATYAGPSVQSVTSGSHAPTKTIIAVVLPILLLVCLVTGYVSYSRYKSRKKRKRWSQVLEQRMSMVSNGTWRPSVNLQRPSASLHRPSASINRPSGDLPHPGLARPDSLAIDTQASQRVSFALEERPSLQRKRSDVSNSGGSGGTPTTLRSVYTLANSPATSSLTKGAEKLSPIIPRTHRGGQSSLSSPTKRRSGIPFPSSESSPEIQPVSFEPKPTRHRAHQSSIASSLRHELSTSPAMQVVRDPSLASFDPSSIAPIEQSPAGSQDGTDDGAGEKKGMSYHMRMASRNSKLNPDDMLKSYAGRRAKAPVAPEKPGWFGKLRFWGAAAEPEEGKREETDADVFGSKPVVVDEVRAEKGEGDGVFYAI